MKRMEFFTKWKFPLFLGVLLSVLYLQFFENRAFVELDITVSQKTWFKIYWAEDGQLYSEKKMVRMRVNPDKQHYTFYLTDLKNVSTLRIDPHQYQGESQVRSLSFEQRGLQSLQFATEKEFVLFQPIFEVESSKIGGDGLITQSTGVDPQFELALALHDTPYWSFLLFFRIAAIFAAVLLFYFFTHSCRDEPSFIPLFFAIVFVLILVMASSSGDNVHPDEYVHLYAGEYYKTNWLPPVVDDPEIHHTYSVYGVSRLNSREISYLFTGKLAELMNSFKMTEFVSLRMFNVLLFGVVLLYLLRNQDARFMAAPLLISPQLWYVFSYCDSDAFALALSVIVACQVALPGSLLTFWGGEGKRIYCLCYCWGGGVHYCFY